MLLSYLKRIFAVFYFVVVVVSLYFLPSSAHAQFNEINRVSIQSNGGQVSGGLSDNPSITDDGDVVAYQSDATNVLSNDSNSATDVFVYDLDSEELELISQSAGGNFGNGDSSNPSISGVDGDLVAFQSSASNLVTTDTNDATDIFIRNRDSDSTTRVSVTTAGSQANGSSQSPAVSADESTVAFQSDATNLVSGDSNAVSDVFIRDLVNDETTRVSLTSLDSQANGASSNPHINSDGSVVCFESTATNLVPGDSNSASDIFIRDIDDGSTSLISRSGGGTQGGAASSNCSISADGNVVAFQSDASNLVSGDSNGVSDIFVHTIDDATTIRVSRTASGTQGNAASTHPFISPNGRYVIFQSMADNLVSGDSNSSTDIFIFDISEESISRISVNSGGTQSNNNSMSATISSDGHFAAFSSQATDLVSSDSNEQGDIFVQNTECLITLPDGTSTTDTDGDGTTNCSDVCGNDEDKTSAGQCGCGIADTDSDSDGTANCNDDCSSDPAKTAAGTCGCGVSDADANSNGQADCNDPTAETVPPAPRVRKRSGGSVTVSSKDTSLDGTVRRRFVIRARGTRAPVARRASSKRAARFRNLPCGRRLLAAYRLIVGSGDSRVVSKLSPRKAFRLRCS